MVQCHYHLKRDECNSRGEIDQRAERKAGGLHGEGRADDLLNLAHG